MNKIMAEFRMGVPALGGQVITKIVDYSRGINGLPVSDVIKFYSENCSVVVRPSGTEPKLKIYISVTAENREKAEQIEAVIRADIEKRI